MMSDKNMITDYVEKINLIYIYPIQKNQGYTSISTRAFEMNIHKYYTDIFKVGKCVGDNITLCIKKSYSITI